jgi:hypothetical protein
MSKKHPLRYRWEKATGMDAHLKRWIGFDGERRFGFLQPGTVGQYQWYMSWPYDGYGPSLPAQSGLEESANLAALALEKIYDATLDGTRTDLCEKQQAKAAELARTSHVRNQAF